MLISLCVTEGTINGFNDILKAIYCVYLPASWGFVAKILYL